MIAMKIDIKGIVYIILLIIYAILNFIPEECLIAVYTPSFLGFLFILLKYTLPLYFVVLFVIYIKDKKYKKLGILSFTTFLVFILLLISRSLTHV